MEQAEVCQSLKNAAKELIEGYLMVASEFDQIAITEDKQDEAAILYAKFMDNTAACFALTVKALSKYDCKNC
jgi:hypothetical protein